MEVKDTIRVAAAARKVSPKEERARKVRKRCIAKRQMAGRSAMLGTTRIRGVDTSVEGCTCVRSVSVNTRLMRAKEVTTEEEMQGTPQEEARL